MNKNPILKIALPLLDQIMLLCDHKKHWSSLDLPKAEYKMREKEFQVLFDKFMGLVKENILIYYNEKGWI